LLFAPSEALAIDLTGTGYSAEHLAVQLLAFLAAKGLTGAEDGDTATGRRNPAAANAENPACNRGTSR
jgi:hypothetical protein